MQRVPQMSRHGIAEFSRSSAGAMIQRLSTDHFIRADRG